jgi:hypothetical protein
LPRRESSENPPAATGRGPAPIAFRAPAPPPPLPPELTPTAPPELQLVAPIDDGDARDDFDEFDGIDVTVPEALLVDFEPEVAREPVPEATVEPPSPPAPPLPEPRRARPPVGLGSFADLRGATTPRAPAPQVAPEPTPVAEAAPVQDPDRPLEVAPDRRATFAEVAQAVDVATSRSVQEPASPFSEDFLPQRLPKRGRRGSRLETPWVRQRSDETTAPTAVPAATAPVAAPPAPLPARGEAAASQIATVPALATNGVSVPESEAAASSAGGGGERFAFFAAFRAAAEQAREEAGIDDRRGH